MLRAQPSSPPTNIVSSTTPCETQNSRKAFCGREIDTDLYCGKRNEMKEAVAAKSIQWGDVEYVHSVVGSLDACEIV